jgi:hypothetical protein
MAEAEEVTAKLLAGGDRPVGRYEPMLVADLPEIAQRYFRHAIAPETPLYTGAELEMEGTFLLGNKDSFRRFAMSARQVLRPLNQFIWMPELRAGALTVTGSDALVAGEGWTRFWLLGLVPVAHVRSSRDLVRSAQFRAAVEGALWLPPTLLPQNNVRWEQTSPDEARVTLNFFNPAVVFHLRLAESGALREVVGQRWSNANPEQCFRLQPFGGTISDETSFQGFTISTDVAVGNHFGTADYLPFFQARITRARYF